MVRLIKNEPIRHNGVYYDFTMLDQKKLQKVYDNNPSLRHFFEADEEDILPSIITTDFEEALAKVGILTSSITNKRLAELKKRREDDKID